MLIVKGYACLEDSFHATWVEQNGRLDHDVWLMKHLEQYVKDGDVILDCGSHIGTHALWYANKVGFNGKVLAFEANPKAFECLNYNCKGLKNVVLFNKALGDKPGYVDVVEVTDNYGMSFTKEGTSIELINIDSLKLDKCNFIKIDCEGAEPNILEGAKETIQKFKPILFIEVNISALERNGFTPNDIFEKLNIFGYSYRNIYETEKMEGTQYDIICQSL